jgi:hypothetical protein
MGVPVEARQTLGVDDMQPSAPKPTSRQLFGRRERVVEDVRRTATQIT